VSLLSKSQLSLKHIAKWLEGTPTCERLVKRIGNELEISGVSFAAGPVKVDVGKFANKVVNLAPASGLAVALDNQQYLLCTTAKGMEDDPSLQALWQDLTRVRVEIMLAFDYLQGLVETIKETMGQAEAAKLGEKLGEWISYMSDLEKHAISVVSGSIAQETTMGLKKETTLGFKTGTEKRGSAPVKKDLRPERSPGEIARYLGITEKDIDEAIS